MITKEIFPTRNDKVVYRVIGGEAVILNLGNGIHYTLNGIGATIWEMCDGTKTVKDIANAISKEYEVSEEEAEADTLELVKDLSKEKLLINTLDVIASDSVRQRP